MALPGNSDEINGYNTVIKNGAIADANQVKTVITPIGAIISWVKTFDVISTGTNDIITVNKLEDSTATFITDGATNLMIVENFTDSTFSHVTAVDSEKVLSLNDDIFPTPSGDTYSVYATPRLPDGWVECNGQVLSDVSSPFDGATIPDLNGSTGATKLFMRGARRSGTVGGQITHNHLMFNRIGNTGATFGNGGTSGNGANIGASFNATGGNINLTSTGTDIDQPLHTANSQDGDVVPPFFEVVMIMRTK